MASWWVYILRCRDETLYTGMARDLDRRLATHVRGRASKYTRAIKRLSRAEKLALIARTAS